MILWDADQRGVLFARRGMRARSDDVQCLDVAREIALCLDLQKARDVRLGQLGHFDVCRQRPLQRQAHNAVALAHADSVEVVANLPADQLGIIGQGIERERDGERLLDVQGPFGSAQGEAIQAAPIQRQPQQGREALSFQ